MNTLAIQKYEEEINRLSREVRRLSEQDRQQPATFYVCTRCGCLYQSVYGCGCVIKQAERQ